MPTYMLAKSFIVFASISPWSCLLLACFKDFRKTKQEKAVCLRFKQFNRPKIELSPFVITPLDFLKSYHYKKRKNNLSICLFEVFDYSKNTAKKTILMRHFCLTFVINEMEFSPLKFGCKINFKVIHILNIN